MAKRLILIVPDGADSLLSILDRYMKEWVTAKESKDAAAATPSATASAATATGGGSGEHLVSLEHAATLATADTHTLTMDHSLAPPPPPAPNTNTNTKVPTKQHSMTDLFRKMSVNIVGGQLHEHKHRGSQQYGQNKPYRPQTSNSSDLPFEMHAFEALLTTVMALETQEFNRVNAQVQVILNYFRSGNLPSLLYRIHATVAI